MYSLEAESRPAALLKLRDIVIGRNETAHELRQRIELLARVLKLDDSIVLDQLKQSIAKGFMGTIC